MLIERHDMNPFISNDLFHHINQSTVDLLLF